MGADRRKGPGGKPSGRGEPSGRGDLAWEDASLARARPFGLVVAQAASRVRADVALGLLDCLLTAAAYASILLLRFDGAVPPTYWEPFRVFVVLALLVHLSSNWMWGLYGRIWRHASVQEARCVLLSGALSTSVLLGVDLVGSRMVPLSVVGLGGVTSTVLIGAIRFQSRLFAFRRACSDEPGLRIAVIGAGEAGAAIVQQMLRSPSEGFLPVVVLDDDRRKHRRSLFGVPVTGGIERLPEVVGRYGVHRAVLAVPGADQSLVRRAADAAEAAKVPLQLLPGVAELMSGRVSVRSARDLQIEDLLGRRQVETDLESVASVIRRARVLITGGGGSIGTEIARQVALLEPEELILLDHDETHLHDAQSILTGPAKLVLADIRDRELMLQVFEEHRPEVVFHAAAHKHVPLLEDHPAEAILTNVVGTRHVVDAARKAGVGRFLFVSTDKAVSPSGVMGASKRLGEQIVLSGRPPEGRYSAVRFGNVLGSRGSVIPTFARQIAHGGPVTVTDNDMTRFFMSLPEAVQLVLQAVALSEGGEVFMLEMGRPVRIRDLAEKMIRLSGCEVGTGIAIEVTGVRPGEKMAEELRACDEAEEPTAHASIKKLLPPEVPRDWAEERTERLAALAAGGFDRAAVRRALLTMATSSPPVSGAAPEIDLIELERSSPWSPSTT